MIEPTVGRILHYYEQGSRPDDQPLAAIVTAVYDSRCVNVAIFSRDGVPMSFPPTELPLIQEGDAVPMRPDGTHVRHCRWMPYQIQQAKKSAG